MLEEKDLNERTKDDNEPMHTTEHILNQTMVRAFGCARCFSAHIERKKSKCDYKLNSAPSPEQIEKVEKRVNEVIAQNLPVREALITRIEAAKIFDLARLPETAGQTLRVVYVGDYDACLCLGKHVKNTSEILQIGKFKIISCDYNNGVLRVRFKLAKDI
jgi:alanyl-tRNA synthetase